MANLRDFLWSGIGDGTRLDVTINRWSPRIGSADVLTAKPLHLAVEGEVRLLPGRHRVEIIMPDESPRGTCTVVIKGTSHEKCEYWTDRKYLNIRVPGGKIALGGVPDGEWTWLWVESSLVRSWFGFQPARDDTAEGEAEQEMKPPYE